MADSRKALVAAAVECEQSGVEGLFWGDHLQTFPQSLWTPDVTPLAQLMPSPNAHWDVVAALATVGATTSRLRVGASVTEALRRHPAVLAQEWLTLHHLTEGRAILGIGAGEAENVVPYGISFDKPVGKMEEAIRIIRLLWEAPGPVDYDGEFWTLRGAVLGLGPYNGSFPPIWTGTTGPRGLRVTGELADGWQPHQLTKEAYARGRQAIVAAAGKLRRDISDFEWGACFTIVLAPDQQTCYRLMQSKFLRLAVVFSHGQHVWSSYGIDHPLGTEYRGVIDFRPDLLSREELLAAIDAVPDQLCHDLFIHGTPDDVVAKILAYREVGVEHVLVFDITPLAGDPSLMAGSMQRLQEVLQQLAGSYSDRSRADTRLERKT
ncbi:MAG: LLM class flavin-dependent oxidoreductase [Mycobacterium sp.]